MIEKRRQKFLALFIDTLIALNFSYDLSLSRILFLTVFTARCTYISLKALEIRPTF